MIKCPFCEFDNEDGVLFCEHCKSDLGVAEPAASHSAAPSAAGSLAPGTAALEVASPLSAVAVAEAGVTDCVPVAQIDAGAVAPAEIPIAVAVPLPDTGPLTVAPEGSSASVAETTTAATAAAPTSPDAASPIPAPHEESPSPPVAEEMSGRLPPGAKPKLVVLRGQRVTVEYPLYDGDNYLGRADEKAVDIDLEDQEPPDRIWSSRQHAVISYENGLLSIEDLNSTNGTFVNRTRVHPGQRRPLAVNDVIQIGTVQLKVKV